MECSFVRNITCLFNVERFSIEDVHKTSAGSRETICLCTLRWILLPVLLKWEIAPVYHGSSFLSTSPSSLSTLLRADCRFLSLFENELGLWTGLQMCKWKYCKPKITMLLCVLLKLTKIKLLAVHTFCEAQGKGRASAICSDPREPYWMGSCCTCCMYLSNECICSLAMYYGKAAVRLPTTRDQARPDAAVSL